MKKPEPRILTGVPQELGYPTVGSQPSESKEFLERFLMMNSVLLENAPLHIAVHLIHNLDAEPAPYTQIHCHPESDEIGLIVAPKGELEYEIILDGKANRVRSPAAVYIPAGTYHRSRVLSGKGVYVCIILDPRGPSSDNVTVVR